jgi:hypothetical protein
MTCHVFAPRARTRLVKLQVSKARAQARWRWGKEIIERDRHQRIVVESADGQRQAGECHRQKKGRVMGNTCEYCGGNWFSRNLRGGLICSGCAAPAPIGARMVDPLSDQPVALLTHRESISQRAYERLEKSWREHFPGQQLVILEEGMTVQFLQQGIMTINDVRKLMGLPEVPDKAGQG